MSVSPLKKTPRKLARLPDIGDQAIPGSRFTRRVVSLTLWIFVAVMAAAVITATLVSVTATVDGDGVLEPVSVWRARSPESGTLTQLLVRTGDTVRANQVLARLDPTLAESDVAELNAQIAGTRSDIKRMELATPIARQRSHAVIAQAQASVMRAREGLRQRMADLGILGDVDSVAIAASTRVHTNLDAMSADLVGARASLASAVAESLSIHLADVDIERKQMELRQLQARLLVATRRVAQQYIRAPSSGVVLTEDAERLTGSQVNAGEPLLEVADVARWHVNLALNEHEVHRVHLGDRVDVEILALTQRSIDHFHGRVRSVGWQPVGATMMSPNAGPPAKPSPSVYRVLIEVDSTDLATLGPGVLRRGYAAKGKIVTRQGRIITLALDYVREKMRGITR